MADNTTSEKASRVTRTKRTYDVDAGTLAFSLPNASAPFVTVTLDDFPLPIQRQAALQGLSMKIAKGTDKEDDAAQVQSLIADAIADLKAGEWSERGGGAPGVTLLAKGVVRAGNMVPADWDEARVVEELKKMDKAIRDKIEANADVAKAILAIKRERAGGGASNADVAKLFGASAEPATPATPPAA